MGMLGCRKVLVQNQLMSHAGKAVNCSASSPGWLHLKIMQTVDAHSLPSLVSHFAGGQHTVRANRVCIHC